MGAFDRALLGSDCGILGKGDSFVEKGNNVKYGATKWVHSTYTHRCMEGCLSKWDGFVNDVQFEVGVGDKVRFWHDRWFGEHPLKEQYLALYSLVAY